MQFFRFYSRKITVFDVPLMVNQLTSAENIKESFHGKNRYHR